jgi:hypothetical protein
MKLVCTAVVASLGLGLVAAHADTLLFGASAPFVAKLYIDDGSGPMEFTTDQGRIRPLASNQGWWSLELANIFNNDSYNVGTDGGITYRNFFTFDLSNWSGQAQSAYLQLDRSDTVGDLPATFRLFDVSTDAATLNQPLGIRPDIYDDLGTGVQFGEALVTDPLLPDPLIVNLNSAALSAIDGAAGGYFSLGGTAQAIPEPGTLLLLGAGLIAIGVARTRVR